MKFAIKCYFSFMFNYEFGLAHIATADTVKEKKNEKKHLYEHAICRSCVSSVNYWSVIQPVITVMSEKAVLLCSSMFPDKQRCYRLIKETHKMKRVLLLSPFKTYFIQRQWDTRPFVFAVGTNIIRSTTSAINASRCSSLCSRDNKTHMEMSRQHD